MEEIREENKIVAISFKESIATINIRSRIESERGYENGEKEEKQVG